MLLALDPQVVGFADIMEMLMNYDYIIDCTSVAGGTAETWGMEAGHGVVSASQMLGWVQDSCREACGEIRRVELCEKRSKQ